MIFAAIDPGAVSAAIAVFSDATPLFVDDIRTTSGQIDSVALAKALHDMRVAHAVIESVHSMPRQGVSSTFKFGMGGYHPRRCRCPAASADPCDPFQVEGLSRSPRRQGIAGPGYSRMA